MRLIRERATTPTDDLLSDLVHADGDKRLHENEVLSIALGLLVAGNESTRSMLTNGMAVLARRPEIAELLRAEPERVPDFVEELLRYDSSVQIQYRRATSDVELAGTVIPKGERVAIALGSANRDEGVRRDPAEFDLDRDNKTHLTFGYGEHLCIGAALARAQLKVGLTQLVTRFCDWRVAASGSCPTRTRSATLRGFTVLPLSFRKAGASDISSSAEKSPW
jgi:cytochrome P450